MTHWRAKIGTETRVWRQGEELPPPPGERVSQLLRLLGQNDCAPRRRKNVASILFPDSTESAARNALRQTLLRLKRWVGEGAILADHETICLRSNVWQIEFEPTADLTRGGEDGLLAKFRDLILEVSQVDRDEARAILVGGKAMALSMTVTDLKTVLEATKPVDSNSPGAFEHLSLRAMLHLESGRLYQSYVCSRRVFTYASNKRMAALMTSSAAEVLFSLIECGDLDNAREWLPVVTGTDRTLAGRLLTANARACFYWNDMDLDSASEQFAKASKLISQASRFEQVHYWCNYAVFAMEYGFEGLWSECQSRAMELHVPGLDAIGLDCLALAQAVQLRFSGEFWASIKLLEERRKFHIKRQNVLGQLYSTESAAESYALVGNTARAFEYWRWVEKTRSLGGGKLTPRLHAIKSRIVAI